MEINIVEIFPLAFQFDTLYMCPIKGNKHASLLSHWDGELMEPDHIPQELGFL
jgi:hypothetical protein